MARIGLLNSVDAKGANGVDADLVDRARWRHRAPLFRIEPVVVRRSAGWRKTPKPRSPIPFTLGSIGASLQTCFQQLGTASPCRQDEPGHSQKFHVRAAT